MEKALKTLAIIIVSLLGLTALALNLVSFLVGNGSLGSSVQERATLTDQGQREVAYEIYKQSCSGTLLSVDDFTKGMTVDQAEDCNAHPNPSGIKFVGGNGNEMYLLSHYYWDIRVLYATYYLLERGFDGPEQYSLKMDCSPPGFNSKTKMTLGVHYGMKNGQVINFINSIQDPTPNRQFQYLVGTGSYIPEGSARYNNSPSLSPHAFGQALDIYQYGCTSVYVRLDSEESASRWACGSSPANGSIINDHSYFYPIKNIPIEMGFINSSFGNFSTNPENQEPDPKQPYLLSPRPDLIGCNGGSVVLTVPNTCNPPIPPEIPITYSNAGCIAQNQPNNPNTYYRSNYFYNSLMPGFHSSGQTSRVQPFQFTTAIKLPNPDNCTCTSTPVANSVPQSEKVFYQTKTGPITLTDPDLVLTIPPEQKKTLNDDSLKRYLTSQAEASRKIILEASMLFSIRENSTTDYQEAETLFKNLIGLSQSDIKQMKMNQIVSPTMGNYRYSAAYLNFAELLYGVKNAQNSYNADLINGHKPGLGYNSSDKDRIHLGF
jgi:hypothetical protein